MKKVSIGGKNRLGSGNKRLAEIEGFGRSTFNLDNILRTTMSAGTLVPFLVEPTMPGDVHEIDLEAFIRTMPTIGPMFGTFKVQLDVFSIPQRLYIPKLQMNMLGLGRDMSAVKLPLIKLESPKLDFSYDVNNQQTSSSSLLAYLGIRGAGKQVSEEQDSVVRYFNAIPLLGYMDICKQYYCNPQEDNAYQIHRDPIQTIAVTNAFLEYGGTSTALPINIAEPPVSKFLFEGTVIRVTMDDVDGNIDANNVMIRLTVEGGAEQVISYEDIFNDVQYDYATGTIWNNKIRPIWRNVDVEILAVEYNQTNPVVNPEPRLVAFPLSEIDDMKSYIVSNIMNTSAVVINQDSVYSVYSNILKTDTLGGKMYASTTYPQEGLLVKTYQADINNNWLDPSFMTQVEINTRVDTSTGYFSIDQLNVKSKLWKMQNAINMSGGNYDDYIDAVYDVDMHSNSNIPLYEGGLIQELGFDEVVSTAGSANEDGQEPLGTLAGRGNLINNKRGGKVVVKTKEHGYIIGIVSITPRVDYSQGNEWHLDIINMDQWHKPDLDRIGFQDLTTDTMAYWSSECDDNGNVTYSTVGKIPAWSHYMTKVNRVLGNFAKGSDQDWMVNNRGYVQSSTTGIADLTTYIDPVRFNHIFADTRRDAMNFWVQIAMDWKARRVMSSKVMPKL